MKRSSPPILVAILLLISWASSSNAQSGLPYSLDQCISYGVRNSKNIKNVKFDKYLAQKQVNEFKGIGLPQITGNAGFQQYGDFPVSLIDISTFPGAGTLPDGLPDSIRFATARFGVKYNASVGGQISQLLFDGSFFVGLKAAKAFVDLSEINVQRTEIETAVNITKAYYSALVNEERAQLLTTNLSRMEDLLHNTEALFKEGFVEKIDVDRLRINRNNLKSEKMKVERMVSLGYDMLKFQMGMPINQDITLTERITDKDELPTLETLVMDGNFHENRIEMRLMEEQIHLQELNITRNRAGLFGSLVAFGNFSYQTNRPRFFELNLNKTWFPNSLMGLSYNVTIFDGLQKRARVQTGQIEIAKVKNQMDMFEQSVQLELRSASTSVINTWTDVEMARENKVLGEEVYRVATTKYSEGVGSNLEVLDAEKSLLDAQINYLSALYSYVLANVELKRVKGEFKPLSTTSDK